MSTHEHSRWLVIALLVLLAAPAASLTQPRAPAAVADAWSPIIGWMAHTGQTVAAIHATLMKDGRVLLFGVDSPFGFLMTPPPVDVTPSSITMVGFRTPVEIPEPGFPIGVWSKVVDTFYCGGHATMADGSVLVVGGTRTLIRNTLGGPKIHEIGLNYAATLGLSPLQWARVPEKMKGTGDLGMPVRWYPSVTRLPDGRMLVTSGSEYVTPPNFTENRSVEIYTPGASGAAAWTLVSTNGESPQEIFNLDYSHVFQLPQTVNGRFDLMIFGELGKPVFLAPGAAPAERWLVRDRVRPGTMPPGLVPTRVGHHGDAVVEALPARGPNFLASTVMLPIRLNNGQGEAGYHNGTVLAVGGQPGSTYEHTVDVYDPVADAWVAQVETGVVRLHPATVVLPDGRVLIIAGHSDLPGGEPGVGRAQYIDPRNGFALSEGTASMPEVRGYHTVTLLLPDGRVLVGGGNPDNSVFQERDDFRFYYPDYMSKPRPAIVSSPSVIGLGASFDVQWAGARPVTELVLIALGSMTHAFDFAQRSIELEVAATSPNVLRVQAPDRAEIAPPGHYMLFAVDADRVPSVAQIVKLQ